MAVVRRLNRSTARRLRRHPAVAAVWFKGSYVRGPFRPFASDVDLVLLLRDAAVRSPAPELADLVRLLRGLRWRNPSVRDWWQHLIAERELPLVERFWYLFGSDEWRDEEGERPALSGTRPAGGAELALLAEATWAQQCLWSASAVQTAIDPGAPFHDSRAGERKAAFFAARLRALAAVAGPLDPAALFELRRRQAHEADAASGHRDSGRGAPLADLVRGLEASADRIRKLRGGSPARLAAAAPPLPAAPACLALLVGERTVHAVVRDGADARELAQVVEALRAPGAPRRPLGFLVPERALGLWPEPCTEAPLELLGAPARLADPAHEPAQLLFDTLFLPSSLRLALGFPDAAARLRRLLAAAGRSWLLYRRGRGATTFAALAAELRAAAAPAEAAALAALEPGVGASAEILFRAADALARDLAGALLERAPAPAAALAGASAGG